MQGLRSVLSALSGWFVIVACCYVVYKASILWETSSQPWPIELAAFIGLLLVALILYDSGLGLLCRQHTAPQSVVRMSKKEDLFLLFHGYNGSGDSLVEILGPYLAPYGKVVGFAPSFDGYDHDALLKEVMQAIDAYQPDRIFVYAESYGGMVVADLLRRNPWLHFYGLTLNATPAKPAHLKLGGWLLRIFNYLPGGPVTTALLRWKQKRDVANSPTPEAGVSEEAMQRAQQRSLRVTAPMAFDQLGYMGSFDRLKPGEFQGRVVIARFIHAPGSSDAFIKNDPASEDWRAALLYANFEDVTTSWPAGMHTPTPERPSEVVAAILQTVPAN